MAMQGQRSEGFPLLATEKPPSLTLAMSMEVSVSKDV